MTIWVEQKHQKRLFTNPHDIKVRAVYLNANKKISMTKDKSAQDINELNDAYPKNYYHLQNPSTHKKTYSGIR